MDNLTRFETEDGIELVIDTATGKSFATQAGYARMSGIAYPTIRKRVERAKGSDIIELKTAEIQTPGGLQVVTLIPEFIIADWIVDDNPKLAKAMLKAGVRLFIHQLAGFDTKSKPPTPDSAPKLSSVPEMMEGKRNSERREMFLLEDSPAITSDRMKRMIKQKRMLQPSPKLQSFNNDNRPYALIPSPSKSIPDGYTLQLFAGQQYWVRSDISDIAKRQPIASVSIVPNPGQLVEQTEKEPKVTIITPESHAAAISRATANIAQVDSIKDAIASEFKPGTRQGKFIEVLATRIVDKLWEKIQQFLGAIGFKATQTIDVVPTHNPAITQTLSTATPSSLPPSTPEEQIPIGYIQLDDRWISPELYEQLRHQ